MQLARPHRKNAPLTAAAKRAKVSRQLFKHAFRPAIEQLEDRCLMAAGVLDTTFDFDGLVTSDFTGAGFSKAIALDPNDGTLVVAGAVFNPTSGHNQLSVARYSADGTLITSFGTDGLGTVDFPGSTSSLADTVTIQADGKIIAAGFWSQSGGPARIIAMARFNTDGSLDTTFGVGGIVSTNLPGSREYIRQVAVQSDGKILAAAFGSDDPASVDNQSQAVLLRYNADGSLDATFDGDGYVVVRFPGWRQSDADDLVIQADGKIILSGYVADTGRIDAAMMRLNADGSLDTTFGTGGLVETDLGSNVDENIAKAMVQADGKIVAVGFAEFATRDAILVRYNADGTLDTSFGTGGKVILDHSESTDSGYDLAIQSDGKIVMVGFSIVSGNTNFFVSRFDTQGALDTTFGTGGVTTTDFAGGSDTGWDVVIQNGDKITIAGSATISGTQRVALARYIANEAPSTPTIDDTSLVEGEVLTVTVIDSDNDSLTYHWDFDNNGSFDLTTNNGALTWAQLNTAGITDGTSTFSRTLRVQVDDGHGHVVDSAEVTISITNAPPAPNLSLDSSFGNGGLATIARDFFSGITLDNYEEIARQSDGKFVFTGQVTQGGTKLVGVWRANADGSVDTTFGGGANGGIVLLSWPGITNPDAQTIGVQADDKIVVGGRGGGGFLMARLTANGVLDGTFSGDGLVATDIEPAPAGDQVWELFFLGDGRIVASGSVSTGGVNRSIAVARYNSDGSLDTSFGGDGTVSISYSTLSEINGRSMTVDSLGRIILTGSYQPVVPDNQEKYAGFFHMVRFNADGTLDTSFGTGGTVFHDFGRYFQSAGDVFVQPDGKIVTAGQIQDYNKTNTDLLLTRWNADGTLDTTFGTNGIAILKLGLNTSLATVGLERLANGDFLSAFTMYTATGGQDFLVARWNADGTLDTSFGNGGLAGFDFGNLNEEGRDIVLTDNGNAAVMMGRTQVGGTSNTFRRLGLAKILLNNAVVTLPEGGTYVAAGSFTDPGADATWTAFVDYGDGTPEEELTFTANKTYVLNHVYTDNGTYTVTVRVVDKDDAEGTTTQQVIVTNVPPTLGIDGDITVPEGTYTLDLSRVDPGDDTLTWTINWGDGNTQQVTGHPSSVTHVYDGVRNYTITASASDEDGSYTVSQSINVRITNVAPTLTIAGDAATDEGSAYTLDLASIDPGIDTIQKWTINWGDGSKAQVVTGNPSAVTHVYADGLKNVTISATATTEDGTFASNNLAVTVNDVDRVATISGAASIVEGSVYTLNLASVDPGADKVSKWIINWGDGKIQTVTGSPAKVNHSYLPDGGRNYTITATAFDEDGNYASNALNITVDNAPPTAKVTGPKQGLASQLLTFTLSATDPSSADRAAGFIYTIDWGDGSAPQTTVQGSGTSFKVQHTFTSMGIFPVQVTATDKDGGVSLVPASWIVTIPTDGLHPDPVDPSKTALFITGTPGNDTISIAQNGKSLTSVIVTVNGVRQGIFSPTGRIIVYGDAGNDTISVGAGVKIATVLHGEEGNDVLTGGGGNDILVGGAGNDSLRGGLLRDLLLGGLGSDTLFGDLSGQYTRVADAGNILIGNPTLYDDDLEALTAILTKWNSADSFATRVDDLTNGNGVPPLTLGQLTDDLALDKLYGGGGQDWFWTLGLDQTLARQTTGSNPDRVN